MNPDDPKPTPTKLDSTHKLLYALLAGFIIQCGAVGYVAWDVYQGRAPTPEPAPVIKEIVPTPEDSTAETNGKRNDAVKAALIGIIKSGSGTHTLTFQPDGQGKAVWAVTVSGGVKPEPEPGPKPKPEPKPTPKPTPAPTGFAGEVAAQAKGLPAKDCLALAENYQTVASMIAAGGLTKMEDAIAEITRLNKSLSLDKQTWTPFANWLAVQFDAKAQGLPQAREIMFQVVTGLEYVGGGN